MFFKIIKGDEKLKTKEINGSSDPFGFKIYNREGILVQVSSDSYKDNIFLFIIYASISATPLIGAPHITVATILAIFLYYVCELTQWHATEHKLINVLEKQEILTIESLKKASKKHPKCGGNNIFLSEPSCRKIEQALEAGKKYIYLNENR